MKATCPHCGTTYRIDPRKVPAGGVQARCSRCGGVFAVSASPATVGESPGGPAAASAAGLAAQAPSTSHGHAPGGGALGAAAAEPSLEEAEGQVDLPTLDAPPRAPQPPAAPAAPAPFTPAAASEPPPPPPSPAPPPAAAAPTPPPAEPPSGRAAAPPPPPPPLFGKPDPHGKARRLARALISDIAVYNPERRERGLADGTLRQEFREEIRKSWDEYVTQVGDSIARGTPYFREALNEILAGGRTVF